MRRLHVDKHLIDRDQVVPAVMRLTIVLSLLVELNATFIVPDKSMLQACRVRALHLSDIKLRHLLLVHHLLLLAISRLIL